MASAKREDAIYQGKIESGDFYVWDNWGFISKTGEVHVYAQYCEKKICLNQEDRYWNAKIRHFVSGDEGNTWADRGTVLEASEDMEAFDSYVIWSGSTLPLDDGRVLMAYTGLQYPYLPVPDDRRFALQSIGLAVSADGGNTFQRLPQPIISAKLHYDRLIEAGYYFGPHETLGMIDDPDGTFMTLRDPFLYQEDGLLHILFGAKSTKVVYGQEKIVNAVGHATLRNIDDLTDVTLEKPILFSQERGFNQCELPNLVKREDAYYLLVSTTLLHFIGEADVDCEKTVRIYRSKQMDTGWEPYGDDGRHIILINQRDHLYGLNVLNDPKKSNVLLGRPFVVGKSYMPETVRLIVGGENPVLMI